MPSAPTPAKEVQDYLRLVELGDAEAAVALVLDQVQQRGVAATLNTLLVPAQVEVGRRWQRGAWSVAAEHVASSITDRALARLPPPDHPVAGPVVVACVEGEWHALPARLLAEQLARRGWEVVFAGQSLPADSLVALVEQLRPVAVALSCTMTAHLPGAWRGVVAAHRAGLPAVVGGAAVGSRLVADRLGADGWARDADGLVGVLTAWQSHGTPRRDRAATVTASGPWAQVEALHPALVAGATHRFCTDGDPTGRAEAEQSLDQLIGALTAALLTDLPDLYRDEVGWLDETSVWQGRAGHAPALVAALVAELSTVDCAAAVELAASGLRP